MMKIYICPGCGRMTAVSRKIEVACSHCKERPMERVKLTFESYTQMDDRQRKDYADSWLYIHKNHKGESAGTR